MVEDNEFRIRPLHFFSGVIIALIVMGLCWVSGYFDTNKTIAAFTALLVVTSTLQWWTYHRQWQQMRIASSQTDRMIEHMRNEQRPWLAINRPKIYYARNDDVAQFQFNVTNHGKTPCAVVKAIYGIAFDADRDAAMSLARLRLSECKSNEGSVIAPGVTAESGAEFSVEWTDDQLAAMTTGELYIFMAGKIIYIQGGEGSFETSFMFGTQTKHGDDLIVAGGPVENYMR